MKKLLCTVLTFTFGFLASAQDVLIFTKTGQYRHACLPEAIKSFVEMGEEQGWKTTFTEDSTFFTPAILKKFDVVVFLLTNKDILTDEQKLSFQRYIQSGGAFVGIHSSTVTELEWPWFGALVGARFMGHSGVQKGIIRIEDLSHPATRHFKLGSMAWEDEWYSLQKNPRPNVNVLIALDENSVEMKNFNGKDMAMGDHPIAWYHSFDGGRVFQTQLGHRAELYQEPMFRKHLIGGIKWAISKPKDE